jgi:hypothetical protein
MKLVGSLTLLFVWISVVSCQHWQVINVYSDDACTDRIGFTAAGLDVRNEINVRTKSE